MLQFLAEHADRLVPKGEIVEAVWPPVFVTDDSLVHCVTEVRQALGDRDQRIIRTVPRRGYRFVAPVAEVSATPAASPATASRSPSGQWWRSGWAAAALALVLLLLVGMAGWWLGSKHVSDPLGLSLPDCPSITVLPLDDLGGYERQPRRGSATAEDLITGLARSRNFLVVARNSSFAFRDKRIDVRRAGFELGVG